MTTHASCARTRIVHAISRALRDGTRKTREQWATELGVDPKYFYKVVAMEGLGKAILRKPRQLDRRTVKVGTAYDNRHDYSYPQVTVPIRVLRAAGLDTAEQLEFEAVGHSIVIHGPIEKD